MIPAASGLASEAATERNLSRDAAQLSTSLIRSPGGVSRVSLLQSFVSVRQAPEQKNAVPAGEFYATGHRLSTG